MRLLAVSYRAVCIAVRILTSIALVAASTSKSAYAQGAGYWHTGGAQLYDSNNQAVRIAGINWYGFETTDAVVHGLTSQDYKAILNTIKNNGYNTIRLPFSNQMVETPSSNLNIGYNNSFGAINTDLQGLNSQQVMDKIVTYAGTIGLKIILDNHRSEAGNSAESNGLWYTSSYPESNWIADWQALAARYQGNSTIIGFDLRNEPHNAYSGGSCWDCGGNVDWHLAAERGGNAVLAINPSLLIFVEGTDAYNNNYYWWGGNLQGVANSPVVLSTANRLVYSAHDYGPNEYAQSWFNGDSAASLAAVWTQNWAYINQQGLAPVWVGEFGTENSDSDVQGTASGSQGLWFESLVNFIKATPSLSWTNWALNGEDAYGLLDSNYDSTPVSALKQSTLASIQFPLSTGTTSTNPPAAPASLSATAASASQVNLSWAASTSSGVTYTLYFGTSAGSIGTMLTSGVSGTSYQATGLNASTTYYFTVTAVSASGTSGVSPTASATTQAAATTAAPTGLSAKAISAAQINLAWTVSATPSATYNVYSGTSANSISTMMASGMTGTSYSATGLAGSTTYYYAVTAVANSGSSTPSSPASATTSAAPAPSPASSLAATAASATQINLTWAASSTSGVTYSVYTGSSSSTVTTLIGSGVAGTSFSATGLSASTQYFYTVTAVASGTASPQSNLAAATTQAASAAAPNAPSGLSGSPASASQINLSWQPSSTSGVTYSVYFGTASGATSTLAGSGITAQNYGVTGLTDGTTYYFVVKAVSSGGAASAASNQASAMTQTLPSTPPTGLTGSAASSTQVNLSWTAVPNTGATYSVYLGTQNGAENTLVASGIATTSYQVTNLTASTTYYFVVRSASGGGTSSPSSQISVTTLGASAPSAPTGLGATTSSTSQINLAWSAVNGGGTYTVYAGTSSGAETTQLAAGLTGTTYSATGLSSGTTYYFIVKAVSSTGTSGASNEASATTTAVATPPAAPTGLTATTASTSQINLAWTASSASGVTYTVYSGTTQLVSGLGGTSYAATGLTAGTTYSFTVKAVSSAGTSGASNAASATTTAAATPPTAPSGLTATAASTSQINLAWTASTTSGVTYTVYSGTTQIASGLSGTSYAVTGLTANTTYSFTVKAVSSAGTSSASNAASATTPAAAAPPSLPSAPSGLTATATSSTQINLAWTASTTAGVTYNLYSGTSSSSITSLVASGISGTSYAAASLTPSTAYFFAVTAVSPAGSSAASNTASATTQAPPAPSAPTGLGATAASSSSINLNWTASSTSGVTYSVFSGTASGAQTQFASGIGGTSYSATGLTASTAYYFTVKAVNAGTSSGASNEASASTQAAAGGGCHVAYTDVNDWGAGFTGGLTITNTSAAAWTQWTLTWTYSGNQQLNQSWSSNYTQTGEKVTLTNATWNGAVAAGGTVSSIGWNAMYSGVNTDPTAFSVNGVVCH